MQNEDLPYAENAFLQVLDHQRNHVGAALFLARICRARNETDSAHNWLVRAAAACLRLEDKVMGKAVTAMLPTRMPENIFVREAVIHMELGAYRMAARSFLDARRERQDIPLHRHISRACQFTSQPEENMRRLCAAIEGLGKKTTADFLRLRLLDYPSHVMRQGKPSWLDRYPRLKEAVGIATHTTRAWMQV